MENNDKNQEIDIFQKSERIVSALYLVSGLIPAEELMSKIRDTGLSFLSDIYSSQHSVSVNRHYCLDLAAKKIREVVGLLSVGFYSGSISNMNYSLLKKELESFAEQIEGYGDLKSYRSKNRPITREFFAVRDNLPRMSVNPQIGAPLIKDIYKGQNIKDNETSSMSFRKNIGQSSVSKFQQDRPISAKKDKDGRKDLIISVLKKQDNITIKDLSGIISGCSEKTIQRELSSLVSSGVLKKEGEKRWSRYSLLSR